MIKIIYEDNHILVVEKPVNMPVQEDDSKDADLLNNLKDYLKVKYHKPGNVYLGLVHRLDRPVGGVMVFAKTSKAASRLSEDIRNNKIHKTYLAVVEGNFDEKNGTYHDLIKRVDNGFSIIDKDGKDAILDYEVLGEYQKTSLVKINLRTGRHHQIRVQFKYHGHPLCGDQRYNKTDLTQIALYAYELEFIHPVTKEHLQFINYPKQYGWWKNFSKYLQ